MYKLSAILLLTTALLLGSCKGDSSLKMQVMTFNIRLDVANDSANNWANRQPNVCHLLSYYNPDLVGMQEVLHHQLQDLKAAMPQYTAIGVGRDDGQMAGEYCPILFNTYRFELIRSGSFNLSQMPDTFGIRGWDASYNRVTTWVILADKATRKRFAYFNTHLDNDGVEARREGTRLILQKMQELAPGMPTILTGDFNCLPEDEPAQILTEAGMDDTRQTATVSYGPDWSFHDFGRVPLSERPLLDYVFISSPFKAVRYRNVADTPGPDTYYSDHNPQLVQLVLP